MSIGSSATIVITTRNRKDELRDAISSVEIQSMPVEIIVMDDASTDGTSDMVRREFPAVLLERSQNRRGYIVQRNRAARLATGDIIFSIDDDAVFKSCDTVARTVAGFDHPRVGAVAIPYVEPRRSDVVQQRMPAGKGVFVTAQFVGTAHALRKNLFVRLSGYRDSLIHQGEEMDYCIRMLNAGYIVRLGSADPIYHLQSDRRSFQRMDFYGRRNDILFAWHNVPMPYLWLHLLGTSVNGVWSGLKVRRSLGMVLGIISGWRSCLSRWRERQPVAPNVYLLYRQLKKSGPYTLDDIENLLPRPTEL